MAAIDVGIPAIDRSGHSGAYTVIVEENPANLSGKITEVEVYLGIAGDLEVGTCYKVNGSTFTSRDSVVLAGLGTGYTKRTGLNITVEAGDYIFAKRDVNASIDLGTPLITGFYRTTCAVPFTDQVFDHYNTSSVSLYGAGETVEGPTGGISPGAAAIVVGRPE